MVKALIRGADVVACGRLYVYGLAAGAQGMVRLFEILEDEIRICLSLLGVTGYHELDQILHPPGVSGRAAACTQRLPASEPAARDLLAGDFPPRRRGGGRDVGLIEILALE